MFESEHTSSRFDRIDARFDRVDAQFDRVDQKFDTLRHDLISVFRGELVAAVSSQTRMTVIAVIGTMLAVGGMAIAFAQLP